MTHEQHLIAAGLATIYRGRLIPIIRGGDGRDEHQGMFPEVPQDFADLTDDELSSLADAFKDVAAKIVAGDEETLGDRSAEQVIEEMTAGVETREKILSELKSRADAEQEFTSGVKELAKRAGVDETLSAEAEQDDGGDEGDGDGDDEGDGAEASAEAEVKEPVAASAGRVRRPLPAARRHKPSASAQMPEGAPLLTASGLQGVEAGRMLDKESLGRVLSDMIKMNRINPGTKVIVASAHYPFPEERRLDIRNGGSNIRLINEVTSHRALVASGGLCNPLTPVYTIPGVESTARPVRDALANFQADRGGVQVPSNFEITDYDDATGVVTSEQDEQGGTFAFKSCMRIECPTFTDVIVDSIYRCIEVGNLTARAYPELLERIDTLVRANHARLAETVLLDAIKAGSTAVDGVSTAGFGAVWNFLGHVAQAAAGMRSRHRMTEGTTIRALLPFWLIDLLQLDVSRGQFDRFQAQGAIEGYLSTFGIAPAFYLDGPSTGTGQIFGAQTAGNQLGFPADVQWAVFPEGSWLHLDAGQLDLGIVRDSTLNSTNDYQVFAETWEQAAFIGVESQWITSEVCPNGAVTAPDDASALCT